MKKQMKKIFAVVMALTMVFAMSASAFAASGNGYYVVGSTTSTANPINVKVVIDSKQEDGSATGTATSEVYDVTVSTASDASKGYTVRDAMLALGADTSNDIEIYDSEFDLIDSADTYIYAIANGYTVYMPSLPMSGYELDGWMFRVNGKLPLESYGTSGPWGATIATTPIAEGDVIHFYWDYPYNETSSSYYSANFLTAETTYGNGTLSIQLKKSFDYFDNSYYWHISDFENFSNGTTGTYNVKVYNANSTATPVATGTISKSGSGSISCNLTPGTYYVKVDSADYRLVESYDDTEVYILKDTMAFEKFVVQ